MCIDYAALSELLLEYFEDNWMTRIAIWNVHGKDRRTNNAVEGWHIYLRLVMTNKSFWKFLMCLHAEATRTAVSLIYAENVIPLLKKKTAFLSKREVLIKRLDGKLAAGEINPINYLKSVSAVTPY